MATNDPTQNNWWSDTPGVGGNDFEELKFDEIEIDDLFWRTTQYDGAVNPVYRKLDEYTALDLHEQEVKSFEYNTVVFQRI